MRCWKTGAGEGWRTLKILRNSIMSVIMILDDTETIRLLLSYSTYNVCIADCSRIYTFQLHN